MNQNDQNANTNAPLKGFEFDFYNLKFPEKAKIDANLRRRVQSFANYKPRDINSMKNLIGLKNPPEGIEAEFKDWEVQIDGSLYKGTYNQNTAEKHGYGIQLSDMGDLLVGYFDEDEFKKGFVFLKNQPILVKILADDQAYYGDLGELKFDGIAEIYYFSNTNTLGNRSTYYKGNVKDWIPDGEGLIYYTEAQKNVDYPLKGNFVDGQLHGIAQYYGTGYSNTVCHVSVSYHKGKLLRLEEVKTKHKENSEESYVPELYCPFHPGYWPSNRKTLPEFSYYGDTIFCYIERDPFKKIKREHDLYHVKKKWLRNRRNSPAPETRTGTIFRNGFRVDILMRRRGISVLVLHDCQTGERLQTIRSNFESQERLQDQLNVYKFPGLRKSLYSNNDGYSHQDTSEGDEKCLLINNCFIKRLTDADSTQGLKLPKKFTWNRYFNNEDIKLGIDAQDDLKERVQNLFGLATIDSIQASHLYFEGRARLCSLIKMMNQYYYYYIDDDDLKMSGKLLKNGFIEYKINYLTGSHKGLTLSGLTEESLGAPFSGTLVNSKTEEAVLKFERFSFNGRSVDIPLMINLRFGELFVELKINQKLKSLFDSGVRGEGLEFEGKIWEKNRSGKLLYQGDVGMGCLSSESSQAVLIFKDSSTPFPSLSGFLQRFKLLFINEKVDITKKKKITKKATKKNEFSPNSLLAGDLYPCSSSKDSEVVHGEFTLKNSTLSLFRGEVESKGGSWIQKVDKGKINKLELNCKAMSGSYSNFSLDYSKGIIKNKGMSNIDKSDYELTFFKAIKLTRKIEKSKKKAPKEKKEPAKLSAHTTFEILPKGLKFLNQHFSEIGLKISSKEDINLKLVDFDPNSIKLLIWPKEQHFMHKIQYIEDEKRLSWKLKLYSNGRIDKGWFNYNSLTGEGTILYAPGSRIVSAKGSWFQHGYPMGEFEIKYRGGALYNGHFEAGYRNGRGTLVYPNGEKYEGGWDFDRQDDQGGAATYTTPNGYKITGSWVNGYVCGQTSVEFPTGLKYEGDFKNGCFSQTDGRWFLNDERVKIEDLNDDIFPGM